jgi:hypothetical protein
MYGSNLCLSLAASDALLIFKQSSVNKVMCKVFLRNGIFLVIATDRWTIRGRLK